ncbi:male sterility protein [Aureobasidium subglaciale]|nr:male sterility protein [Aureobasidium subglaciale]
MVPIATTDLAEETYIPNSDVYPAKNADVKLRELWTRHGDPQSERYTNPELDSLAALVRYNARIYPDQVAYLVPSGKSFDKLTWSEFDALTDLSAAHYAKSFTFKIDIQGAKFSQPTIALLGVGNTFDYWVAQIGLCKLGVRLLLLSDKNADVARDHLLDVCNATGMVTEAKFQKSLDHLSIQVVTIPSLAELRTVVPSNWRFECEDSWNQQAMIIHSSGSTGLPKPIVHTNRSLMLIARMYRLFQSFVVENWYNCFPLFHIAGVSIILGGLPSALPTTFPPEKWPPSPGAMLSAWRDLDHIGHPVDCLHCAPSVIEDLYEYLSMEEGSSYSALLRLKILQPGGAALSPVLLKKLTDMGVNVKTTYGSTEIGPPFRTIPDTRDNSRCYNVRYLFPGNSLVEMEPQGEGLFECVVYKGFPLAAELWQTPDAPNPYRTNDLFEEKPPGSGLFVLQGRKDDIIVHSNGEKTNALPLQMTLEECHSGVSKVVVFGTDYPCTSAIVQFSAENSNLDHEDILRSLEGACKAFPVYSQLDRSMILILPRDTALPVTPKGNVRRKEAWKLFGDQIDQLYANLLYGSSQDAEVTTLSNLDPESFVQQCVANVFKRTAEKIKRDASFYDLGLNSQMAIRLRPLLARRFGKFPLMYVFEYHSVERLAHALSCKQQGQNPKTSSKDQFIWIHDVIKQYSAEMQSWPRPVSRSQGTDGQVVYLTGATGALGNALIAELATNSQIRKIYCAVRGSNARERLADQLQNRGYAQEIFKSNKVTTIPYDMACVTLGLNRKQYAHLASEVTTVIHNAWKMDFNQRVDMFEKDCLRGSLNLMRFCQESVTKLFVFTSSVATNMGKAAATEAIPEAPIADDSNLALETGYAQSKFIIERLTQEYSRIMKSPVQICRVGQLCGHTTLGSWNSSEMFPIMVATGLKYLGAMPTFDKQQVDWLPVDVCANAISTLISQTMPDDGYSLHNLVNPSSISWSEFLDALELASGSRFKRIDMDEWVTRLQDKSSEDDTVPGAKLLGFFEAMAEEEQVGIRFETSETAALVPKLKDCTAVNETLLRLYLRKWRSDGFL